MDEKKRDEYYKGILSLSEDFPMNDNINIGIEDISNGDIVGKHYSNGTININRMYLDGREKYDKGDGSLAWHSAHEYAHEIQKIIMKKQLDKGFYLDDYEYTIDYVKGTNIWKKVLTEANKKANKIEGVKYGIYDRLQSISNYANPKRNGTKWREGHSEVIGKYIQSGKDSKDVFGRLVYEETLRWWKDE